MAEVARLIEWDSARTGGVGEELGITVENQL